MIRQTGKYIENQTNINRKKVRRIQKKKGNSA